jgi:dTDP-4-amino-4,6-dideoxygalactose transaminase
LFYILLPTMQIRNALIAHLKAQQIMAVFHYVPLHCSPMGKGFGYEEGDLPVTEDISGRLLRLPFYYDLTQEEQLQIVDQVSAFLTQLPAESLRREHSLPLVA